MGADAKYDVLLPRARGKIVALARATYIGGNAGNAGNGKKKYGHSPRSKAKIRSTAAENILGKIKARDISRQDHRAMPRRSPFYFVARGGGVPGGTKRRPGRETA